MTSTERTVADRLTDHFGDTLRAVVAYDENGVEPVRMGDAARSGDPAEKLQVFRLVREQRFPERPYGARRASVHAFESIAVIHVPVEDDRGVVATADPEVIETGALSEFLTDDW